MEVSETKKPNRYVALVTYLIAIVCLLLGLFLPLFNGKGILALQLPRALNSLANKEIFKFGKEFTFAYPVMFFGKGKPFDFMALIALLYALITVLGLLALIPVGISVKKDGKAHIAFIKIIETAAVIVLSLYLIIGLEWCAIFKISYNMIIAFGGSLLMLILICFMTKGKSGIAKFFLLLLSLVAFLALFNFTALVPKLDDLSIKLADKLKLGHIFISSGESSIPAVNYLSMLFEGTNIPIFSIPEEPGYLTRTYFEVLKELPAVKDKAAMVLLTIVAFVAVVNYLIDVLALSTNGKRAGLLFNVVRYGLAFLALVAFIITALVCKYKIGLMLILFAVAVVLQVLISVLRFVIALKKAANKAAEDAEETITFAKPPKHVKQKPEKEEPKQEEPARAEVVRERPQVNGMPPRPRYGERPVRPTVVDMEVVEKPVKANDENSEVKIIDEPEQQTMDTAFKVREVETGETAEIKEPVREIQAEEIKSEPYVREVKTEPVHEIRREPVREVRNEREIRREPVREVKPEREIKREPVREAKPEPAPAPAQEIKREPVREVRTAPVQQVMEGLDTPPAQPVSGNIYIVGQSSDEFLKKLTNDEKFEFMSTFIEKTNGKLGSVPEYVIGGDNRKFFSSVFIYLGRLRGMISDNLLDKMYKELNML